MTNLPRWKEVKSMKKLIISVVFAMSLMVGVTGVAAATQPDNAACGAVASQVGSSTVFASPAFSGDPVCDSHTP